MKKLAAPSNPQSMPRTRSFKESPIRTRRGMWPLADGYLESNVVGGFLRGLTWFVGLFMAFVLVSGAQKVASQKMPLGVLFEFMLLQMPRIIVFTIPSSFLFGTVSTFTEMSSRGELTALMAGGMSLRRMLRAPLVAAVVLAGIAFWLQEKVAPQCELRRGALQVSMLKNAKASQIFPIVGKNSATGKVEQLVQADDFDQKNLVLTRPDIRLYDPDGSALHITAQSARWDKARGEWVFVRGRTTREPAPGKDRNGLTGGYSVMQFDEQSFKTQFSLDPAQLNKDGRDLPGQLALHNFEMVSMQELAAYRATLATRASQTRRDDPRNTKKIGFLESEVRAATFGIHDKLATPLVVFAMLLIGAPLGIRPQRTASAGLALGLSLMVLLSYYIVWTLVTQWGKGGFPAPILAAYLPFLILTGLGALLIAQKS